MFRRKDLIGNVYERQIGKVYHWQIGTVLRDRLVMRTRKYLSNI